MRRWMELADSRLGEDSGRNPMAPDELEDQVLAVVTCIKSYRCSRYYYGIASFQT